MYPCFTLSDKLILAGIASACTHLEVVTDVDPSQPIGRAMFWGMWSAVYAHRVTEQGQHQVVAHSPAGYRWMRPEQLDLPTLGIDNLVTHQPSGFVSSPR